MKASPPAEAVYAALEEACRCYEQALAQSPAVRQYLRERGIGKAVERQFRIGYAPPGNPLLNRVPPALRSALEAADMVRYPPGRVEARDRFYRRIMFPIRDLRGRVQGFGGRALEADGPAKYINSSDHLVFRKGQTVYGLYERAQAGVDSPGCVVVEGYMDVVGLAQHGVPGVVAPLGTAVKPAQIEWLFASGIDEVVLCFDADAAGRTAARRGFDRLLPLLSGTRRLKVARLPHGHDPDSYVRAHGAAAFRRIIARAAGAPEYLVALSAEAVPRGFDPETVEGKAALAEIARGRCRAMPLLGAARAETIKVLARRLGADPERMRWLFDQAPARRPPASRRVPDRYTLAENLIRRLVNDPSLAEACALPDLDMARDPELAALARLHRRARAQPDLPASALVAEGLGDEHGALVERLFDSATGTLRDPPLPLGRTQALAEFRDGLEQLARPAQYRRPAKAPEPAA